MFVMNFTVFREKSNFSESNLFKQGNKERGSINNIDELGHQ